MCKVKNLLAPEYICDIFYKQSKNNKLRNNDFPTSRDDVKLLNKVFRHFTIVLEVVMFVNRK